MVQRSRGGTGTGGGGLQRSYSMGGLAIGERHWIRLAVLLVNIWSWDEMSTICGEMILGTTLDLMHVMRGAKRSKPFYGPSPKDPSHFTRHQPYPSTSSSTRQPPELPRRRPLSTTAPPTQSNPHHG